MGQTSLYVWQTGKEDDIASVVVVCLEDKLRPFVVLPPILQELVQGGLRVVRNDERFVEVCCPVRFRRSEQDVGRCENHVVVHDVTDRRAESHEPDFAFLTFVRVGT